MKLGEIVTWFTTQEMIKYCVHGIMCGKPMGNGSQQCCFRVVAEGSRYFFALQWQLT